MNGARYRLQRKQTYAMPNVLGNRSFPVFTYKWIDIAVSDDFDSLKEYAGDLLLDINYRIKDTWNYE